MNEPLRCPACTHPLASAGIPMCPACGLLLDAAEALPPTLPLLPTARRTLRRREETFRDDDRPRRPTRRLRRGPEPMHGAAVAAIILGSIGCLTACVWPLALTCAIPGLICAGIARTTHSRGTAAAGFALSASATFAALGFMVVSIVNLADNGLPDKKTVEPKTPAFFQ